MSTAQVVSLSGPLLTGSKYGTNGDHDHRRLGPLVGGAVDAREDQMDTLLFWLMFDFSNGKRFFFNPESPIEKGMVFVCRSRIGDVYLDPTEGRVIVSSFNERTMNVEYDHYMVDDVMEDEYGEFGIGVRTALRRVIG